MQKWKSGGVALLHKGARGPQRISSIGIVKGQNFAHFQNWNRNARLIYTIELDCLKNLCSVNYSRKFLTSLVQADRVSNIDVNGNKRETSGARTGQMRHFGE